MMVAPALALQPVAVGSQSALEPAGPAAAEIAWLWDLMLVAGTLTTLLVVGVLAWALFRPRGAHELPPEADRPADPRGEHGNVESGGRGREDRGRPRSERVGARWTVIGGAVVPAVVLTALFVLTLRTLGAIAPSRDGPELLTIEVTGKQWWWEVRYVFPEPSQQVTTANEIRIPAGRRVRVLLRATDVIHSFWVPGLNGKTDMIPGRTNVTWLEADRPGAWRGQCAEFCGLQHAKMALVVVAQPAAEFAAWLARQRGPAAEPRDSLALAGREAFLASGCALCHGIRGTPAVGGAGPDLTHVGSRVTLAAGELPNTKGHLAGWIGQPQALKPGARMPAVPLDPAQQRAIVHYLLGLR